MFLDTATIYQIFWLSHVGRTHYEIASELGISRNSVSWHLSGRQWSRYPQRLRERLSRFASPLQRPKPAPAGRITLYEASWFYFKRPTIRSLVSRGGIEKELCNGRFVTRWEWARRHAMESCPNAPVGVFATADAMEAMFGIKPTKRTIVCLADVEPRLLEKVPAGVVSASVRIMAWTEMPYVTITGLDVMLLSGRR